MSQLTLLLFFYFYFFGLKIELIWSLRTTMWCNSQFVPQGVAKRDKCFQLLPETTVSLNLLVTKVEMCKKIILCIINLL